MSSVQTNDTHPRPRLRLWPGVIAAVLLLLVRVVLPLAAPSVELFGLDAQLFAVLGGLVAALMIVVWWLFFSRAPWSERLGVIAVMIVAIIVTRPLTHISIQNGMMGMMFVVYAVPPTLALALVSWAVIRGRLSKGPRWAAMVAAMLIGCGVWTLARTNGIHGGLADLEWRWTPTAEERLVAQEARVDPDPIPPTPASPEVPEPPLDSARGEPIPAEAGNATAARPTAPAETIDPTAPATANAAKVEPTAPAAGETKAGLAMSDLASRRIEWPGFRGPGRDSVVRGVRINSDWSQSPPVEMWRRPIGPGWSSFAVNGDLLYTQEQRGDEEVVACHRRSTGEPVWRHRYAARFWESNGGPGPRGTPTLGNGRVYALGATGILNALDASNGKVVWTRNAATDTGVTVPDWGVASSPLVVDDIVIVAVSGQLVAYDARTGDQKWLGPKGGAGYSSPHLITLDEVPQVLLLRGSRTISVAPADGTLLWEHVWAPGVGIVQPALAADGDVLIVVGDAMGGLGIRRLAVRKGSAGWDVEERWTSRGLKPYFNDFVVHKGHAFGFDGAILSSINLENGNRNWKGGRYGSGQMLLLAEQDLLLVISEDGELALVSATPDKFTEVARLPALNAKTWNHPVVVGDMLLIRNGEEMAAFRLPLAPPLTELR